MSTWPCTAHTPGARTQWELAYVARIKDRIHCVDSASSRRRRQLGISHPRRRVREVLLDLDLGRLVVLLLDDLLLDDHFEVFLRQYTHSDGSEEQKHGQQDQ